MNQPPAAHESAAAAELQQWFEQHRRDGRNDAAYCVAHAGEFMLGDACPREIAAFAEQYRPARPKRATTPLDDSSWLKQLYHDDNDPYVGKVFESVLAIVRKIRAQGIAKFALSTRDAVSPSTSSIAFVRALGAAGFALAVPTPLIFLRPQHPAGIAHLASEPIASVAGANVLSGLGLEDMAFIAGHHMALYRADLYVRVLYGSAIPELTTLFLAVVKIGKRDIVVPPAVEAVVEQLELLVGDDAETAKLVRKVAALFAARGEAVDMARWVAGVERTALRAGFLLCGDLAVARRVIASLPDVPADALADLTTFAMSEDYFALRQSTGIALWADESDRHAPAPSAARVDSIMPMSSEAAGMMAANRDLSALRSVEIPLFELEGARFDPSGMRSVEIPLHELESRAEASALRSSDVEFSDFDAPTDATGMRSVEISLDDLERRHGVVRTGSASIDESSPGIELPTVKRHQIGTSVMRRLGEGAVDSAFVMASVWSRREPDAVPQSMREFIARERTRARTAPTHRVSEQEFEDVLRDPGEKTVIGQLIAALSAPLRASQRRRPEDYGFDREHALGQSVPIVRAMLRAADLLAAPMPLVFALDDHPAILARPPCEPIISIINPEHCASLTAGQLDFLAGEHVAFFRAERHGRVLAASHKILAAAIAAVVDAFATGQAQTAAEPFVAHLLEALGNDPAAVERARSLVTSIPVDTIEREVQSWCEATERTAIRAGLLASADFDAAVSSLAYDRGVPVLLGIDAKTTALEDFALSEEFASLRAQIAP